MKFYSRSKRSETLSEINIASYRANCVRTANVSCGTLNWIETHRFDNKNDNDDTMIHKMRGLG